MVSAVAALAVPGIGSRVSWLWREERPPVSPPTPEAALALSASRGDHQAFARLVDAHKRVVYGLCLRLLGDGEEARDAAQETFVRAFTALHAFDPAQPFAPWVLRIARNHCLDQLRRRTPERQHLPLDGADADGEPRREYADPEAPRADEALERAETRNALQVAVAALPPNYREVVHLFHVEHLSYKEIAAAMDVPIGTVMTWLHRARGSLRQALAGKEVAP
jgi:RNA polymerase sigma-70 factor (ECF subfamily)